MVNKTTLSKISFGCSVTAIALSGIAFNINTETKSLYLKLEDPIYSNYSDAIRSDNSEYKLIPYYVYLKDKLFDSYHKP
ncbi:MAG: hypothetical protein AABX24_03500 [Nanoarchaeota archaeon]